MSWFKKKITKDNKGNKSISRTVILADETGLHIRPASQLAKMAGGFESEIFIKKDGRTASAKSIMEILTLGAAGGSEIEVTAEGEDALKATETIADFIEKGFVDGGE